MGSINLYKIDSEKQQEFFREISRRMQRQRTMDIEWEVRAGVRELFGFSLYTSVQGDDKQVGWKWVLDEFEQPSIIVSPTPKAIVVIEKEDETVYAVTFGFAFFLVDKFCDRDFGFNFARKLTFKEIKTTTLTTPSSHRNKMVNTYINYNELEFDSGESFAKLKAKVALSDEFDLYKPSIEIGNSIKFSTVEESLVQIILLILHIEHVMDTELDKYKIPVFSKIKDEDLLLRLEERLTESIHENPAQVNISELDIIGATEIFNHNDSEFVLRFNGKEKVVFSLSSEEIEAFCQEQEWNYSDIVLDISVVSLFNGQEVVTNRIKKLIDYTDDEEKCLLSRGVWYKYNDDYLNYLRDSIAEISVEYHPEFDFSEEIHDAFIEECFVEERNDARFEGKTEEQIRASLKRKYYAERAFNLLRQRSDGFQNFDRIGTRVGGAAVEEMDLYKDGMMCAVKIGNTSAKLCYAVDQSLTSLKLYKKHQLPDMPSITTVVLWLVLERQGHIEDERGKPDLNRLEMLMLKNRLDQWKKEVRLQGFQPLVYINYRTN